MKKSFSLKYIKACFCLFLFGMTVHCLYLENRTVSECKARNSYNNGYFDATKGYKDRFQIYNKKCREHGVILNQNLYIKGYEKRH